MAGTSDGQLNVSVGSSYDGSGISAATQGLNQLAGASTATANTISRNVAALNRQNLTAFNTALTNGTLQFNRLGNASNAVSQQLARSAVGTNQAAFALTNLGRVAQDAPFGFIGIQNNLNPLLESFQRLRAETGSNGAALRALGQSLMGPAGVGIALSLVTSAITFYTMWQQRANKATNDAKKGTDDYIATLDQLTQASLKGAENATKELTTLNLLYSAYQNANLPLKTRKEAYKELQDLYPAYFKNIDFEQSASIKTTQAYNQLTDAILATGRARAAVDLITKNSTRQLENRQKVLDLEKNIIKQTALADKLRKQGGGDIGSAERGDTSNANSTIKLISAENKIKDSQKAINDLKTDSNILTQKNIDLSSFVNTQLEKGGKLAGGIGDAIKSTTIKLEALKLELPQNQDKIFEDLFSKLSALNTDSKTLTVKAPKGTKIDASLAEIILPTFDAKKLKETLKSLNFEIGLQKSIEDSQKAIDKLLSIGNIIESAGSGIANGFASMGEALINGNSILQAGAAAVLNTLGQFAIDLGASLIKQGAATVAAGIALNLIVPGSGAKQVAGGFGLIAAGALLSAVGGAGKALATGGKNSSSQGYQNTKPIPGFANGVSNYGGGLALVGERGPELLNLPKGSSVTTAEQTRSMMMSGGNGVVINGKFDISLDKLYVRLEQIGKQRSRQGV